MSSIRVPELALLDEYMRGDSKGWVLDFTNRTMADFFLLEFDVDLYGGDYEDEGPSKASHLRSFLRKVDDATAARAIRRLTDYRQAMDPKPPTELRPLAEGQVLALIARLSRGGPPAGTPPTPVFDQARQTELRKRLNALWELEPQPRGLAFEAYLADLFKAFRMKPRKSFSLVGEQIDGSFELHGETYLLEAKWTREPIGSAELRSFQSKVEDKAAWARGLFVSFGGFTNVGLEAFGRGRKVVCMEGRDIYDALGRGIPIDVVLERKVRHAAETGRPLATVKDLFSEDG